MKRVLMLLLLTSSVSALRAGTAADDRGYVRTPMAVHNGIVFSDNYGSALYLRTDDGTIRPLVTSPGAGTYFSVSRGGTSIGLKIIDEHGQTPALLDPVTGVLRRLAPASGKAGQVSFLDDGRCAFTVGDALIITDGSTDVRFELGTYANIAPVSPDGRCVVFNDGNDQLWTMDLLTKTKTRITGTPRGCFNPQWSADSRKILYSSLNGFLFVYDPLTAATTQLGEGYAPAWSADGQAIAFYKKEIRGDSLTNADIYVASPDGRSVRQVTFTPDVCEMDPSFGATSSALYYQTYTKSEVVAMTIANDASPRSIRSLPQTYPIAIEPKVSPVLPATTAVTAITTLDVPYVNQVYDTPDWFNGHSACGPTTAVMALAYFNILPVWETSCATPTRHTNNWGKYVSETYNFKGRTYSSSANDPNKRAAQGIFGYMWSSGSPYSNMSQFYYNHGISSATFDAPPHADAIAEIAAGNLYSICNGLTTAGHIVLAHGIDAVEAHTIIVNDPYGNKNKPGYPNNYGKDAKYDWPGYNNGNQNFNTVFWASTVHYTPPAAGDSVVDDLQFGKGFFLNSKTPATMSLWKDKNFGYMNHFWHVYTTYSQDVDTCYGMWTPTLARDGAYEVFVNIPYYPATYAAGAKYKVFSKAGLQTVVVDQKSISKLITKDTLVSLGTFDFAKGSTGYVRLGDATGIKNDVIVLDAVMWKYRGASVTSVNAAAVLPARFELGQNFPNPFNPSTQITFALPTASRVSLTVFDVLGRTVAALVNGPMSEGSHTIRWTADAVPGGVYYYRLSVGSAEAGASQNYSAVKKMVYVK